MRFYIASQSHSVHNKTPGRSHHEDYIEAIVKCEKDPLNDLTAMLTLVKGECWLEESFENLNQPHNAECLMKEEKQY